ncbi:hypothetical protein ACJ41O_008432 [Fusarium nematophilum]
MADTDRGSTRAPARKRIPHYPPKPVGWDPFNSFAVSGMKHDEQFMLHYAFSTTWSAFGESETGKRDFAQSWMWRTMESPAAFYAQILGSSTHYLISCPAATVQHRIITQGLQWKVQAITSLRSIIGRFQAGSGSCGPVPDSVLLAIFILAVHGSFDLSDRPHPHPLSPLATYRDMHIYGRMNFGQEHVNALYHLVEKNGGIQSIDQNLFGCVLHLLDMLYCARIDAAPRFPCSRQRNLIVQEGLWTPDSEAACMLTTLGGGLRPTSDGSRPPYLEQGMVEILDVMVEITTALEHYCRGGPGAPTSFDVLANNCDWMSHALLSLPPYTEQGVNSNASNSPGRINSTITLQEICRLGALIFLDMVILPTPPHTGIKLRHSTKMLDYIETMQQQKLAEDPRVSDFLTWATVLGAIAARFTKLQVRYTKLVEKVAQSRSWSTTHTQLKRYLWFGPVCDVPALSIWSEVREDESDVAD